MSEGETYKRQKVSEDVEVVSFDESNLKYQNACLSSRIKDYRKEISELNALNKELSLKVNDFEETFSNFNCNWAKVNL